MHEYGLFKLLIPALEKYINDDKVKSIKRFKLSIGKQKNIVPEHLEHAFEHFQDEYPIFKGAKMEYDITEPKYKCSECGYEYFEESPNCPKCGAGFPDIIGGNQFTVEEIEVNWKE